MSFLTYIIQSEKNGRYYIGHTQNISERLLYHNNGRVTATHNKGPWRLVYSEEYENKLDANRRELEIKAKRVKDTLSIL